MREIVHLFASLPGYTTSFKVVHSGITGGMDAAHDREVVAAYQQVGVICRVEKIMPERWGADPAGPLRRCVCGYGRAAEIAVGTEEPVAEVLAPQEWVTMPYILHEHSYGRHIRTCHSSHPTPPRWNPLSWLPVYQFGK